MKPKKSTRHFPILGLAFLIVVAGSSAVAQNKPEPAPEIAFTVSMPKPHTHMLEVEVRIKRGPTDQAAQEQVLVMPVWTPGSYLIREFERHVQDFAASDASGRPLQLGEDQQRFVANRNQRLA